MRHELIADLFRLIRAQQEDVQGFDETAARLLGINLSDLRAVGILDRMGRMAVTTLAREARLTTGSMTALIDRLERAGYARRIRDDEDRRRVYVELTDRVRKRMEPIWGPIARDAAQITERYSDEELRFLVQFFTDGTEMLQGHHARIESMRPEDLD